MARDDERGNMVLSPRSAGLGAGKGGEMMRSAQIVSAYIGMIIIIMALLFCIFISFSHAFDSEYEIQALHKKASDKLIAMIYHNILFSDWTDTSKSNLMKLLLVLEERGHNGPGFVDLTIDIIMIDLEHNVKLENLYIEKKILMKFTEGHEYLIKWVDTFLEENGFNKEKE